MIEHPAWTRDPATLDGEPVFTGTTVPVAALFAALQVGQTISQFLAAHPEVTREQAIAPLEYFRQQLLAEEAALDRYWEREVAARKERGEW